MATTKKQSKKSPATKSNKTVKSARKVLNGMSRKERKDTIAFLARSLIAKGYDNERVFTALQKRFGKKLVPDTHRGYPAWYRQDAVKRGLLTKREAYSTGE